TPPPEARPPGAPRRLSAIRSTSARCPSSPYDSHWRSVVGLDRTNPGAMLLTVMPHGPRSCASARVSPSVAAAPDLVRHPPPHPALRRLPPRVRLDAGEADAEAGAAGDVDDPSAARGLHP